MLEIGNHDVGGNVVEADLDAQVLIRHTLCFSDVEALHDLHRLQALQHLAEFVVTGDIDITCVVALGQRLEGLLDIGQGPVTVLMIRIAMTTPASSAAANSIKTQLRTEEYDAVAESSCLPCSIWYLYRSSARLAASV